MDRLEIKSISSKSIDKQMESIMGFEISDNELITMEPELLLRLQQHLKEQRENNLVSTPKIIQVDENRKQKTSVDDGLTVLKSWRLPNVGADFDEVETPQGRYLGIRVTQNDRTYIGKNWKITDEVKRILSKSAELGYSKFWRFNHPQDSYLLDSHKYTDGIHHIGCSKSHSVPWIFVLAGECLSRKGGVQTVKEITFNSNLEPYIKLALKKAGNVQGPIDGPLIKSGEYKKQKGGGKCLTTHPLDFDRIIEYIAKNLHT